MIEKYCGTWEAFKEELCDLERQRERRKVEAEPGGGLVDTWSYRGLADSKWKLQTTLERKSCEKWYVPDYGELILSIYPEIQRNTGKTFVLPKPEDYRKWARQRNGMPYFKNHNDANNVDFLKYLIYLRHHEFPSPLLDWTECPYIAAYFAFLHEAPNKAEHAAIFAYLGWAGSGKSSIGDESSIEPIGPAVIGDTRHYVQQSRYTVAFQMHYTDEFEYYSSHEDAFGNTGGQASTGVGENQDFLRKFVIPAREAPKVRRELYERNITNESLFNADARLLSELWCQSASSSNPELE